MVEEIDRQTQKFCHECGAIIFKEAEICVKCGVGQSKNSTNEKKPFGCLKVFLILFVFCIVVSIVQVASQSPEEIDQGNARDEYIEDSSLVKPACENEIRNLLLSPSTAKFLPYEDKNGDSVLLSDKYKPEEKIYIYVGEVDSQNSFAAMVRNKFTCQIKIIDAIHQKYKIMQAGVGE